MKIQCSKCGKKYKSLYTQCPDCGHIEGSYINMSSSNQVSKMTKIDKVYIQETNGTRAEKEERHKPVVKKKRGIIKWVIGGLLVGMGIAVAQHSLMVYREASRPKTLDIKVLKDGEKMETHEANVSIKDAQVMTDEWLRNYIPKGYKLIGIRIQGENKEKQDKGSYDTSYYISYTQEGEVQYMPVLEDSEIEGYVESLGYNVMVTYSSFYGDEEGVLLFLVEEEVQQLTFCYTQLLHSPIKGYYKGVTYELPLPIKVNEEVEQ